MAASYIEALLPAPFDTDPDEVGTDFRDWRWNNEDPLGTPVQVEFKFITAAPNHAGGDGTGFQALTPAQQASARTILGLYEEICKIDFVEITSGTNADLLIGRNNQSPAGYAYFPDLFPSDDVVDGGPGGDIWVATTAANLEVGPGERGWATLIHEVGHALGLKHPGNYGPGDEAPFLPPGTDSHQYTVMSYTEQSRSLFRTVTDNGTSYSFEYDYIEPSTPMLYDIAAIQHLYGANMTTRAGNNSYTFDRDTPFFKCIWDAGGSDTISVSNFTRGCTINLNAGKFSSIMIPSDAMPSGYGADPNEPVYNGSNNLSIAFGVTIEKATGGSGNDKLTGNAAKNTLTGNGGNDTLDGGAGNDVLNGGAGKDKLVGGAGSDTLTWQSSDTKVDGGGGSDTLKITSGSLNLLNVSQTKIVNIETINMTGANNNTLTLNASDVLDISSTDILKVMGDEGDIVDIVGSFTNASDNLVGFNRYTFGNGAVLQVDVDITNVG